MDTARLKVWLARARETRPWLIASALLLAFAVLLTLWNGPSVIMAPSDVFILLDGAWRLIDGQEPHKDFSSPIGVFTYYVGASGMRIAGLGLQGYAAGNAIVLAVFGGWSVWTAFTRFAPARAAMFAALVILVIAATRPLGYAPDVLSYAMLYNRYGWALLILLAAHAFVLPNARWTRGDAVALGVLAGLLFYVKATYFVAGAGAVALALYLRPELRQNWARMTIGFLAVVVLAWIEAGANPVSYLRDISAAGAVQSAADGFAALSGSVISNLFNVLALAVLAFVWGAHKRADWRRHAPFAFLIAAGFFVAAGNATEGADVPIFAAAALLLVEAGRRAGIGWDWRTLSGAALAALVIGAPIAGKDAWSIANTTAWRGYREAPPETQRFDAERLRSFVVPDSSQWRTQFTRANGVPARVNEALMLLREHAPDGARVLTLALTNQTSFALGWSSPRGAPLWWDVNQTYSDARHPAASFLFSDVDVVLQPIVRVEDDGCCAQVASDMERYYGAYLTTHFIEVARGERWILLKKR